ncbi:MAG: helicase-associated domain-containing protein [Anaerolineae bacterium]|nr:helicase-associated domain-containing protein [Anaerolineae bacterium]
MQTLQEALADHSEVMILAIAGLWRVETGDRATLPGRLAEAMLDPERLQAFLEDLGPEARAALAQVAAAGGSVRGHHFAHLYGEVRRLGPRAIEREAPWLHPANVAERLYYAGLVFRRYGRLGTYHGELYYVPQDLLEALPRYPSPVRELSVSPGPGPAWERDACDAFTLDMELVLARLRIEPALVSPDAGLPAGFLAALGSRWRGPADPERLALLGRLAMRSHLVVRRQGLLQVGARARAWLQWPTHRRQALLFDAWQGDPQWNELWRIPSLHCEDTGWRNDPLAARQALLGALRQCPDGWVRIADLVAAIKAVQPDFARPDGDYDSWYIRSAVTGHYLQGFAHWDDVEGALLRHLIVRSLYWLGAIALGGPEGGEADRFRLTPFGRACLGLAAEPAAPRAAPLVIREDLSVVAPRGASAYDRARLERFALWQGREGDSDLFRLEPECAWRALNAGVQVRQIEGFLRRASGRPVPAQVSRALRAWQGRFERVALRRAILLQTADAETLRLLRADAELGQRLGSAVSERAVLVPEDQLPEVLARLKRLGWWPRLEGLSEP